VEVPPLGYLIMRVLYRSDAMVGFTYFHKWRFRVAENASSE
jgi:hypothetical protein